MWETVRLCLHVVAGVDQVTPVAHHAKNSIILRRLLTCVGGHRVPKLAYVTTSGLG